MVRERLDQMFNFGGLLWIVPLVVAWAFAASVTFTSAFNLALFESGRIIIVNKGADIAGAKRP